MKYLESAVQTSAPRVTDEPVKLYEDLLSTEELDRELCYLSPPSIWAGQKTPDLNNEKRFLRGGSDQEVLTLEEDMVMDHTHDISDPGH